MRMVTAGVLLGLGLVAAPAGADEIELSGGIGGGEYSFRTDPLDDRLVVPFREAGARVEWRRSKSWSFGLQASVRDDVIEDSDEPPVALVQVGSNPGESNGSGSGVDDVIRSGTRWRLAPFAQWRWRDAFGKVGFVAGNYYNPMESERGVAWVYPQWSIGLGSQEYQIEIGFMDSPALASSADGGMGVFALRIGFQVAPAHRLVFGAGAPYQGPGAPHGTLGGTAENGYLSYAYRATFGTKLQIDLGGYTSTITQGGFVAVGWLL
jgi:hypothetical protein